MSIDLEENNRIELSPLLTVEQLSKLLSAQHLYFPYLAERDGIEPSPATNQWNSFQGCLLTMNSTLHNSWRIIIESNNHPLQSGTGFEAA